MIEDDDSKKHMTAQEKRDAREKIAADVEAFLAKGGCVDECKPLEGHIETVSFEEVAKLSGLTQHALLGANYSGHYQEIPMPKRIGDGSKAYSKAAAEEFARKVREKKA